MRKLLFAMLAVPLLLTGCHRHSHGETGIPVVTRITVSAPGGKPAEYTNPEKMKDILNRIRMLGQEFSPESNPALLNTPTWQVILQLSNGTQSCLRIRSGGYLQRNDGPWRQTDAKSLGELLSLLEKLPPDSFP